MGFWGFGGLGVSRFRVWGFRGLGFRGLGFRGLGVYGGKLVWAGLSEFGCIISGSRVLDVSLARKPFGL